MAARLKLAHRQGLLPIVLPPPPPPPPLGPLLLGSMLAPAYPPPPQIQTTMSLCGPAGSFSPKTNFS